MRGVAQLDRALNIQTRHIIRVALTIYTGRRKWVFDHSKVVVLVQIQTPALMPGWCNSQHTL